MKQLVCSVVLSLITCLTVFSRAINSYEIHFSQDKDSAYVNLTLHVAKNHAHLKYFLLSEDIVIKNISVNHYKTDYSRTGDTIFIDNIAPIKNINLQYAIPLIYYAVDNALSFRREGRWYPYREDELLTAKIYINEPLYYIICGQDKIEYQEVDISNELHLFLLLKATYSQSIYAIGSVPFYFYRDIKDTLIHEASYYQEFADAYNYYHAFFGHSTPKEALHIIEIFSENFQMCQSLKNVIIFGNIFYQIYLSNPLVSWIPHEVVHQWWGNTLFCIEGINSRFLEESITEYIKIQYVKNKEKGYPELLKLYAENISTIENIIPVQNINALKTREEIMTVYDFAPLQLEKINVAHPNYKINELLKSIFKKRKKNIIDYKIFLREIDNPALRKTIKELVTTTEK